MQFERMICLVGDNPLPVYLGIRQFAAPGAEIVLVYSQETQGPARNLELKIGALNAGVAPFLIRKAKLEDPWSPKHVRQVVGALYGNGGAALNYTGGTKVMSAYSIGHWPEDSPDTFYLEEARRQFRFSDGRDVLLSVPNLTLKDLSDLHGVRPVGIQARATVTWQDLYNIFQAMESLPRDSEIPEKRSSGAVQAHLNDPARQSAYNRCLALLTPDTRIRWDEKRSKEPKDHLYQYSFFANHVWFEELIRLLVLAVDRNSDHIDPSQVPADPVVPEGELACGQYFHVQGQRFETDLVAVVDQRIRYISVSATRIERTIKGKMFEAMYRAQQVGGGLATAAVMCLSRKNDQGERVKDLCRNSLGKDPRNLFFDHGDIERWVNGNGATLREFLTRDYR